MKLKTTGEQTCEGTIPIKNCRYGRERNIDGKSQFLCKECELGLVPSNDYKSCIPLKIKNCLEAIKIKLPSKYKEYCITCKPGYSVNKAGTECEFNWFPIENCLLHSSIRIDRKKGFQTYCKICKDGYYPFYKNYEGNVDSSCGKNHSNTKKGCLISADNYGLEICK